MLACTRCSASPARMSASDCRTFTAQPTPPGASCGVGWRGLWCCVPHLDHGAPNALCQTALTCGAPASRSTASRSESMPSSVAAEVSTTAAKRPAAACGTPAAAAALPPSCCCRCGAARSVLLRTSSAGAVPRALLLAAPSASLPQSLLKPPLLPLLLLPLLPPNICRKMSASDGVQPASASTTIKMMSACLAAASERSTPICAWCWKAG